MTIYTFDTDTFFYRKQTRQDKIKYLGLKILSNQSISITNITNHQINFNFEHLKNKKTNFNNSAYFQSSVNYLVISNNLHYFPEKSPLTYSIEDHLLNNTHQKSDFFFINPVSDRFQVILPSIPNEIIKKNLNYSNNWKGTIHEFDPSIFIAVLREDFLKFDIHSTFSFIHKFDPSSAKHIFSWQKIKGAVGYEVEWFWTDVEESNEQFEQDKKYLGRYIFSDLEQNYFTPELIFPEGRLYVRVRQIGKKLISSLEYEVQYSAWSEFLSIATHESDFEKELIRRKDNFQVNEIALTVNTWRKDFEFEMISKYGFYNFSKLNEKISDNYQHLLTEEDFKNNFALDLNSISHRYYKEFLSIFHEHKNLETKIWSLIMKMLDEKVNFTELWEFVFDHIEEIRSDSFLLRNSIDNHDEALVDFFKDLETDFCYRFHTQIKDFD